MSISWRGEAVQWLQRRVSSGRHNKVNRPGCRINIQCGANHQIANCEYVLLRISKPNDPFLDYCCLLRSSLLPSRPETRLFDPSLYLYATGNNGMKVSFPPLCVHSRDPSHSSSYPNQKLRIPRPSRAPIFLLHHLLSHRGISLNIVQLEKACERQMHAYICQVLANAISWSMAEWFSHSPHVGIGR